MMHQYNELFQLFSKELEHEIDALKLREPKRLYDPVIYTLNMGGKRIRPVLLLMAFGMYDNQFQNAMPVAIALELFHNFTLLHDDIMDKAELRRNKKTVHIEYSENTAILSGDAMSILSYEYLTKCHSNNFREVFDLYTQTALKICEGQQYDMDFENTSNVTVNEYLEMIGLKTAILMAASLKLGALIANAPLSDCNLLYQFGYNLGMAFQLQDDLLDTFGETSNFGKNIGGDISSNKKTFLMLKALELAKGETLDELLLLTSDEKLDKGSKIEKVKRLYTELDVTSYSQTKIDNYFDAAFVCLGKLSVDEVKKESLIKIANKMMKRQN